MKQLATVDLCKVCDNARYSVHYAIWQVNWEV